MSQHIYYQSILGVQLMYWCHMLGKTYMTQTVSLSMGWLELSEVTTCKSLEDDAIKDSHLQTGREVLICRLPPPSLLMRKKAKLGGKVKSVSVGKELANVQFYRTGSLTLYIASSFPQSLCTL